MRTCLVLFFFFFVMKNTENTKLIKKKKRKSRKRQNDKMIIYVFLKTVLLSYSENFSYFLNLVFSVCTRFSEKKKREPNIFLYFPYSSCFLEQQIILSNPTNPYFLSRIQCRNTQIVETSVGK